MEARIPTSDARAVALSPGSPGRATVRRVNYGGVPAVLKDYSVNSALFRSVCGAYLARREAAAYRRLNGVAGVPRLLQRVAPDGVLLEYVEGYNCAEARPGDFTPAFFDELRRILRSVRARGVLHGDVKRNVVRTPHGQPVLVDFGASLVMPWWLGPLRRGLGRLAQRYDERAVAKLKCRAAPHLVSRDEAQLLAQTLPLERLLKGGERLLQRCTRWIIRREAASRARSLVREPQCPDESPESSRTS